MFLFFTKIKKIIEDNAFFLENFWNISNSSIYLHYKFEAIHNKDYSVVKTSRAGFTRSFFAIKAYIKAPALGGGPGL